MEGNGWIEYKRAILDAIADLKADVGRLQKAQVQTLVEIERLKIKASLWGAVAGGIPVLLFYFLKELQK